MNHEHKEEDVKRRWHILLKGLGGVQAGRSYRVQQVAAKMIEDIKTKNERFVPWVNPKAGARNGSNQYINIIEFFRKNFS